MNNFKFDGWGQDPVNARLYLLEQCKLDEKLYYGFYFQDGTGFFGRVDDFIPYLMKRFKAHPQDSFEIDWSFVDTTGPMDSGELYPPEDEGEVWDPSKKDPRFESSDDDEF